MEIPVVQNVVPLTPGRQVLRMHILGPVIEVARCQNHPGSLDRARLYDVRPGRIPPLVVAPRVALGIKPSAVRQHAHLVSVWPTTDPAASLSVRAVRLEANPRRNLLPINRVPPPPLRPYRHALLSAAVQPRYTASFTVRSSTGRSRKSEVRRAGGRRSPAPSWCPASLGDSRGVVAGVQQVLGGAHAHALTGQDEQHAGQGGAVVEHAYAGSGQRRRAIPMPTSHLSGAHKRVAPLRMSPCLCRVKRGIHLLIFDIQRRTCARHPLLDARAEAGGRAGATA